MKEKQILATRHSQLYQIYQQQMQMSATIPELSKKNYAARNPANWDKKWQDYLAFLNDHLKPLFRLVHGTNYLAEIKACNEIRASGDRSQSDAVVWNSHTGGGISRTQWIYFSLRLPPYESVSFIGGGTAKIIIDLNRLGNTPLFQSMWFAAHTSVFVNNGILAAQKFGTVTRRAYYYREKGIEQKADNQILCLNVASESETVTKKYLYSDMVFSAEEGLESFFENIFRFFIEQLQFCANHNPFFQELLELNDPSKLTKTIHLWNLIFQGDSFEVCVPGPIPLNLDGIEIDEQRNYFKNTAVLFSLIDTTNSLKIDTASSSNVIDDIKKSLGVIRTVDAVQKVLDNEISPNMRSIFKEPAVIVLVKQIARKLQPDKSDYQTLSLFLENEVDIQVRDANEKSLLEYVAENYRDHYFSSLIITGVQRDAGIIEYFNIAINHRNDICKQFYTTSFFLESILAFADSTPIIEKIVPFCIIRENAAFLAKLLGNRTISPTLRNPSGLTPLMIAIEERMPLELITLLLSKSENINAQVGETISTSTAGWTALHFAVNKTRRNEEQKSLIEFLLENKADITILSQDGDTPGMLLQRLSAQKPKQYSQLQQIISDRLTTNDQIILQPPHNTSDVIKQSVLISVLIQVQEIYYVLMIRKPIQYNLLDKGHLPTHAIGQWWLPGGLIDSNETAIQAAARELFEETGFKIAETDLTEIPSDQNVPIQLSLVISNKIIVYDQLPLIFAGSDAAVVFWVPYREDDWQKTKHNDLLWRKSNWLLVNEHIRFIKNDSNSDLFLSHFLIAFEAQLEYEERGSFTALKEISSRECIWSPYLLMSDSDYSQLKQDLDNWLALGGAFNLGNCQEITFCIIAALAKRNDYEFYLELLKYGLDPNIMCFLRGESFNFITYLLNLSLIASEALQENQSITEEQHKSLQQNSANFIQFSLQMYKGTNGNYLDFSGHGVLSFVCRYNLQGILEQLTSLDINLNGYAAGCALVKALTSHQFGMVERLLEISTVDLNRDYLSQNILIAKIYPIQIFFQDVLPADAPDMLQILIRRGLRVIAFMGNISSFKYQLELHKSYTGNAVEGGLLSLVNTGLFSPQQLSSLLQACSYSSLSRTPEQLEIKAKVLKIFETQLAREISMLCIEAKLPQRFFPSSPNQQGEIQRIPSNADKAEEFKEIAFSS